MRLICRRRMICRANIGCPVRSASTLPGSRVEVIRAWMMITRFIESFPLVRKPKLALQGSRLNYPSSLNDNQFVNRHHSQFCESLKSALQSIKNQKIQVNYCTRKEGSKFDSGFLGLEFGSTWPYDRRLSPCDR